MNNLRRNKERYAQFREEMPKTGSVTQAGRELGRQPVSMILAVDAVAAEEDEELGVYSVSLGSVRTGNEWLISIQLPLNISEQDISLGFDTYAITTSTGATHYDGVLRWGFWPGGVFLDLDDEAAKVLGLEGRVNFQLPKADEINSTIEVGLTRILGPHV